MTGQLRRGEPDRPGGIPLLAAMAMQLANAAGYDPGLIERPGDSWR